MSTYVISDIHGRKREFDEMLELIKFSEDDELWILGDIIDRGPNSADMLIWAIEEAPQNVHFLLGNHEEMAWCDAKCIAKNGYIGAGSPWIRNGGYKTLTRLAEILYGTDNINAPELLDWLSDKFIPWCENLPLFKVITVGNREFMLVHAGFSPYAYESVEESMRGPDGACDGNFDFNALRDMVEVKHGFGVQHSQNMLWEREAWHCDGEDAPTETIFGHTYFSDTRMKTYEDYYGFTAEGGRGKIVHFNNKHGIDCGCAAASRDPEGAKAGQYNLSCLRLDDMEEFYIPCYADEEN